MNIIGNLVPSISLEILRVAIGKYFSNKIFKCSGESALGGNGYKSRKTDLIIPTNADGSTWIYYKILLKY